MRIIKPQQLIMLKNGYQLGRQSYAGFSVVAGFYLSRQKISFINEPEIWQGWQTAPLSWKTLDNAEPKPFAEFLLAGSVVIPANEPGRDVSVKVGNLARDWYVRGDGDCTQENTVSLDHTESFGGPMCPDNPLGRGGDDESTPSLFEWQVMDNERRLHCDPLAAPSPLPPDFYQRKQWVDKIADEMGNEYYLDNYFPGFPPSIDMRYFQTAPASQWLDADEWPADIAYELAGFGHEGESLKGSFPKIQARAFYQTKNEPEKLTVLPLQKKTLWLLPNSDVGLIVFTGNLKIDHMLDDPLDSILIALDHQESPRDESHYHEVHKKRTSADCNEFEFLYDPDLMPEGMDLRVIDTMEKHPSSLFYQSACDGDTTEYYLEIKQQLIKNEQKKSIAKNALAASPPVVAQALETLNDDSNKNASNLQNHQTIKNATFKNKRIQQTLEGGVFEYCTFSDCDFNDTVFTHCQFRFCQFEKCTFKCVNFSEVVFTHNRFTEVSLYENTFSYCMQDNCVFNQVTALAFTDEFSNWKTCQFEKVNMSGAVFQDSIIDSCSYSECQLGQVTFVKGKLSSLIFADCGLKSSRFEQCQLNKCSLLGGVWDEASFVDCQLECTTVTKETSMVKVRFYESLLSQFGLTSASAPGSRFENCTFVESIFDKADMGYAEFINCDMPATRFVHGVLFSTTWKRTSLQQALFCDADLSGAHFEECNLIASNMAMVKKDSQSLFTNCLTERVCWYPKRKVSLA